jgi:hypothetical protein
VEDNEFQLYKYTEGVELDMQLTFAQYTIGAFAFFGSFMFLFFCGTGLVAIPL